MQNIYKQMSKHLHTIVKHVQQIQQTYTNKWQQYKKWQKQYVVQTNAKSIQKCQKYKHIVKQVQNATNIPNKWQKQQQMTKQQYVVQTHAKSIQKILQDLQTKVKHVQKYNKQSKQIIKTSKITKTICCTNKFKTHTNNFKTSTNNNKTCTKMQQTYQTNRNNFKTYQKQYVVITHAKNIQNMSNNLLTIVKQCTKMQQT